MEKAWAKSFEASEKESKAKGVHENCCGFREGFLTSPMMMSVPNTVLLQPQSQPHEWQAVPEPVTKAAGSIFLSRMLVQKLLLRTGGQLWVSPPSTY